MIIIAEPYNAADISTYPQIPSGDLGFWDETESNGEACVATKMNGLVGEISSRINNAVGFTAMMLCIARTSDDTKLPTSGNELDLSPYLAQAKTNSDSDFAFVSAKITNKTEEGSDKSNFVTNLVFSFQIK